MSDFSWGLLLLGAYVVLVILARWLYIARTNVVWTSAQAGAISNRLLLQVQRDASNNSGAAVDKATLQLLLDDINNETPRSRRAGGPAPAAATRQGLSKSASCRLRRTGWATGEMTV